MANIEERIEQIVKEPIQSLGYQVYDVQYSKEGKDYFLRIFIDSAQAITLEDCEKVSNAINDLLDEQDIIKDMYFLEVSSPGVERILRKDEHLEQSLGCMVEINLFKPQKGSKQIDGILENYDTDRVIIQIEEEKEEILRKDIALIKKKFNWEEIENN